MPPLSPHRRLSEASLWKRSLISDIGISSTSRLQTRPWPSLSTAQRMISFITLFSQSSSMIEDRAPLKLIINGCLSRSFRMSPTKLLDLSVNFTPGAWFTMTLRRRSIRYSPSNWRIRLVKPRSTLSNSCLGSPAGSDASVVVMLWRVMPTTSR